MNMKMKMKRIASCWCEIKGVAFENVDVATNYLDTCKRIGVKNEFFYWRLARNGVVIGVSDKLFYERKSDRVWAWPVVPVTTALDVASDCWMTGTAASLLPKNKGFVESVDNNGSKKLAHHIVWAERRDNKLKTSALRKRKFSSLEEVKKFLNSESLSK